MWHGRMLLPIRPFRCRASSYTILVSRSGDGDLSQDFLAACGFPIIRGSSSRGGASALRSMLLVLNRGETVVVTPDGPRGPRHELNEGVAWLAKATGRPVLPVGLAASRYWELKSWDRFNVPKPFAKVVISYGPPIPVERCCDEAQLERTTRRIKDELVAAEQRAFARLGKQADL